MNATPEQPTVLAWIALGSNVGNRQEHLQTALQAIGALDGVALLRVSTIRETEPVGPQDQGKFLNAVAEVQTTLTPAQLLNRLLEIERRRGRVRTVRNGPRTLDLDLLLYGDEVIEQPGLTVPHPRLHERRFVLEPLADLCPDLRHPGLGATVKQLLARLGGGC